MLTLQYEARNAGNKKTGKTIPAVFYGPKESSTSISIKESDFKKIWKEAGESTIVVLKNGDTEHEVLIQDVDFHPVTDVARHVDFYVIEKGKKLQVKVPLEFVGVAPAVKDLGGTLVKVLHELEIEAMPKDLPHDIKVDTAKLENLESQILAKDLVLPSGVSLVENPEEVVAAVAVAKEEVEEPAKTIEDIEIVGQKGKKEEEGAEASDGSTEKKATEKK